MKNNDLNPNLTNLNHPCVTDNILINLEQSGQKKQQCVTLSKQHTETL